MNTPLYQLWQHATSGEIFGVKIDESGSIVGVTDDPIYYTDHRNALHGITPYSGVNVAWMEEHADEFKLHESIESTLS